ncbi:hypothetical protein AVEN_84014-1 [Araneus ventricosus]|uniref:Uncharacterized protein n=1 Tax=Araneus ventricosus TaxID=182803 RepID=A0A4Y2TMH3_ARAVE|nr:hypothetical protein AVEN_84014-1 [Araneus ventricosus]
MDVLLYEVTLPYDELKIMHAKKPSARPSPRVRSPTENHERAQNFQNYAKEESAASVGTRYWTPEGRSPTLYIAFMLYLGIIEWPSRLG